jgi:hypothetical protein
LLIRFEIERDRPETALQLAMQGTKYDPTSWRLQRHIARLLRAQEGPVDSIRGHYDAAIRHRRGDLGLMVELGAYLFQKRRYSEAATVFAEAKNLPLTSEEKKRARETWTDQQGRNVEFSGRIKNIGGAVAWALAIPENFEVMFWRNRTRLANLRPGDSVQFIVRFNAHGPQAHVLI